MRLQIAVFGGVDVAIEICRSENLRQAPHSSACTQAINQSVNSDLSAANPLFRAVFRPSKARQAINYWQHDASYLQCLLDLGFDKTLVTMNKHSVDSISIGFIDFVRA